MVWEGAVRRQDYWEGAPKWAQAQCWGGWAVKDCHVQWSKLGLGAPDAFRKREDAVMESYTKKRPESCGWARNCAEDGWKSDGP